MKRLLPCLVTLFLLIAISGNAVEIYVAPNGSDTNSGTKDQPLATLATALKKARELRRLNDPSILNGIHIFLREGTYHLYEPLFIRPEDAGTAASPTFIEEIPGENPVLSGGMAITGWKKLQSPVQGLSPAVKGKIWVADVPLVNAGLFEFRQLWVNDVKAVRAKSVNGDSMHRILNWDKVKQSCWIPSFALPSQHAVPGMEMFIHQWWAIAILRIKSVEMHGDSAQLFFHQPESNIQSEHPWPAPWISKETGNSAFYLTNALSFLDEPGEWYLNIAQRKLYYWPRNNENLQTAKVIAPALETLVRIQGTIDHPVSNIYFKGIQFQHTGWLRPSQYGHVPHQAGMYMLDAYKLKPAGGSGKRTLDNLAWIGRPAAAVAVSFAEHTGFENCRFEHLASTGLDYHKGVHENNIQGNLFQDIGGTAILAGVFADEASEIHRVYNPANEKEVCDKIIISNNCITNVTNEDWSCVGIGAGYVRNATIAHNEIENVSYTGISVGWGWSPVANVMKNNTITANKIHHYGKHNYDCSGIYTLSAQPGTIISENYIDSIYKAPYAHLPSHWFYLYTDEGSAHITIENNWTPSQKYLQNANGPGNTWINNGPQVDKSIRLNAGLQPSYQWLLKERTARSLHLPINEEHPELIELIIPNGKTLAIADLQQLLHQQNIDSNALYQWQNHYVIFDKIQDISVLQGKLKRQFPGIEVKTYHDLFYQFSKQKHCPDTSVSKAWKHILLTANLVADKKKQQEYLRYHATQFEQWPEVSKGFCNASFQQLLLFRNGRQLMLVISIPKEEELDNLNPKTTENNTRMNNWNNIMKQYQEGIAGTKPGETWVFFNQVP